MSVQKEIAITTSFRDCKDSNGLQYDLPTRHSPTWVEIDLLSRLGYDGRNTFLLFHEERESCQIARPLSDLISIWSPDMVSDCSFCVHVFERTHRLTESEIKEEESRFLDGKRGAGEEDGESEKAVQQPMSNGDQTGITERKSFEGDDGGSFHDDGGRIIQSEEATDGNSITIELHFDLEGSNLNPAIWRPTDLSASATSRVTDLPTLLHGKLSQLVAMDTALLSQAQSQSVVVRISAALDCGDLRDSYVDFTTGKVLVETLEDLIESSTVAQPRLRMVAVLEGEAVRQAPRTLQEIFPMPLAIPRRILVGSIPAATDGEEDLHYLPAGRALIATVGLKGNADVKLTACHIWSVNDCILGDFTRGVTMSVEPSYTWIDGFEGTSSLPELSSKVGAYLLGPTDDYSDLPSTQRYCFRPFSPDEHDCGPTNRLPNEIYIATRYVSLLSGIEDSQLPQPEDARITIRGDATIASLQRKACETMIAAGTMHLVTNDLEGEWDITLWVLPQIEGSSKLYRWVEGPISQFICCTSHEPDGRLYLEVHFVPKAGDKQ